MRILFAKFFLNLLFIFWQSALLWFVGRLYITNQSSLFFWGEVSFFILIAAISLALIYATLKNSLLPLIRAWALKFSSSPLEISYYEKKYYSADIFVFFIQLPCAFILIALGKYLQIFWFHNLAINLAFMTLLTNGSGMILAVIQKKASPKQNFRDVYLEKPIYSLGLAIMLLAGVNLTNILVEFNFFRDREFSNYQFSYNGVKTGCLDKKDIQCRKDGHFLFQPRFHHQLHEFKGYGNCGIQFKHRYGQDIASFTGECKALLEKSDMIEDCRLFRVKYEGEFLVLVSNNSYCQYRIEHVRSTTH